MAEQLPRGTRIEKINSKPGDTHQDGACGTVLTCFGPLQSPVGDVPAGTYGYFVEWDDLPCIPVAVTGTRVREVKANG